MVLHTLNRITKEDAEGEICQLSNKLIIFLAVILNFVHRDKFDMFV